MAKKVITTVTPEAPTVNPFDAACATCRDDVNTHLASVRAALKDGNLDTYGDSMTALKKAVGELNVVLCRKQYSEILKSPTPIIAAVNAFYIDTVKIKEERGKDSEKVTGVNIEPKKSRIDLEKFCEFGDIDRTWAKLCNELLALLTLREVNVFAMKPADLAKHSNYFIAQARAKKEGETPDSNTQVVKLLQRIIDAAIFVDDGTGKNAYKCTNHDLAFIQDSVTKRETKDKCTVGMLNERQFKGVMLDVFAHCLGEAYKVKSSQKNK